MLVSIIEGAKISVLGPVVGENVARPLLGELWKNKRLFAMILRAAPGKNHWVISLEAKPEQEFEVAAGHMKFVGFSTTSAGNNQNTNEEPEETNDGETDISSASDSDSVQGENREAINTSNVNSIQWNSEIVTIDARQVFHSYTHAPVVHIADITNAMPRQFFERFMPI